MLIFLLSLFSLTAMPTAYPVFPELTAETLSGQTITFPEDLDGEVNVLILVFERQAQRIVDTWAEIILSEYESEPEFIYYEVPMISSWYSLFSGAIDGGMRSGIPAQYHDNTATFYGDRSPYFEQLDMSDKSSCYLFVLDREGRIRYRTEGARQEHTEREFRKVVATLRDEQCE